MNMLYPFVQGYNPLASLPYGLVLNSVLSHNMTGGQDDLGLSENRFVRFMMCGINWLHIFNAEDPSSNAVYSDNRDTKEGSTADRVSIDRILANTFHPSVSFTGILSDFRRQLGGEFVYLPVGHKRIQEFRAFAAIEGARLPEDPNALIGIIMGNPDTFVIAYLGLNSDANPQLVKPDDERPPCNSAGRPCLHYPG